MKDLKRLACTADLLNHPHGYVVLRFTDSTEDGGPFDLHPKIGEEGIYLPSSDAPAYRLMITGDSPDVLERAGKALLTLARNQRKAADGEEPDDNEDE